MRTFLAWAKRFALFVAGFALATGLLGMLWVWTSASGLRVWG